jgi:hypothetical protein
MRTISEAVRTAVCGTALMLMALPGISAAAEHGGMGGMQHGASGDHGGMKMEGHGEAASGGHDMAKMGDKAFSGKIGPWQGTARIMDMKAYMEASGMKAAGAMPNSHHVAFDLSDAKTKAHVTEGKGMVTVTGPDKKETKAEFMVMQGHFGADVNLPKPGKYTFKTEIESGGQKGNATFSHTLK